MVVGKIINKYNEWKNENKGLSYLDIGSVATFIFFMHSKCFHYHKKTPYNDKWTGFEN